LIRSEMPRIKDRGKKRRSRNEGTRLWEHRKSECGQAKAGVEKKINYNSQKCDSEEAGKVCVSVALGGI
jgi:hypothetical protein